MASTRSGHLVKGRHMQEAGNDLVIRLEEVDIIVRKEIKRELDFLNPDINASSRLACLIRCRADVQSAITSLLGASG